MENQQIVIKHQTKENLQKEQKEIRQQQKIKIRTPQSEVYDQMLLALKKQIEQKTTQINSQLAQNQVNDIVVNNKIKVLLQLQTKFHNIKDLISQQGKQQTKQQAKQQTHKQSDNKSQLITQDMLSIDLSSLKQKINLIQKQSQQFQPTIEQIQQRKSQMIQDNVEGWTDATHSQANTLDNPDNIMEIDDDMLDAIIGKLGQQQSQSQQDKDQNHVDYQELQQEFLKGGHHDAHYKFGKHNDQKFCVSVKTYLKAGLVMSGGGDDYLHLYKFIPENIESTENKHFQTIQQQLGQQKQVAQQSKIPTIQPFHKILHHQTVNQLELSHDKQHLFSLSQKELLCTQLKTLTTQKVDIETPSFITCHQQGGVFATFNQFNVEIYNVKGFKFYDSFCLDEQVQILKWTPNGKQLVAACDNKVRIITMKNRQITKVTGTQFHQGQITAMSLTESLIFTGCIDGLVYVSNLAKGHILGSTDKLQATINTLYASQNWLMIGSASKLYWYDSNKMKRLFEIDLKGSTTDIVQLHSKNHFAISDIQGEIRLFDKRSPMQQKHLLQAGNTVHQLWYEDNLLTAACQDGCVRAWDLRKYNF